jgi:hypothetical protein
MWRFYLRTLFDDGQSEPKHVTRFLTIRPYVLMVETKLNEVPLKMEVNTRVFFQEESL